MPHAHTLRSDKARDFTTLFCTRIILHILCLIFNFKSHLFLLYSYCVIIQAYLTFHCPASILRSGYCTKSLGKTTWSLNDAQHMLFNSHRPLTASDVLSHCFWHVREMHGNGSWPTENRHGKLQLVRHGRELSSRQEAGSRDQHCPAWQSWP